MTVLKTYPSSSGSAVHEVRRGADGKVYCTCMGWKTSKADPKTCKHLRAYAGDAGAQESVRPPKPKPVGAPEAMLAHQVEKAPHEPWGDERWVMETKYDGWRLFLAVDESGRQVQYARSGLVHDEEWLRDLLLPPSTVLDGEVTSPGVASAYATGTRERLVYAVFDVLQAAGIDFRGQPWEVRRQALEQVVESLGSQYVVPSQVLGTPNQAVAEWLMTAGAEGVMLKRRGSVYESGKRSWQWLKVKRTDTYDVVIVDMEAEPTSEERKRWGWKNLRYGLVIDGRLQVVGTLGVTGPPEELAPYVGKVVECKAYGQSQTTGALRHPQYLKIRADKLPEECTFEKCRGHL